MRSTLLLLVIGAWAAAGIAQAQTAVTPQKAQAAPTARTARPAGTPHAKPQRVRSATDVTNGAAPAKADGVLALGASDITGNKELPKVMVIVPWKGPADAGGVIAPTDSVMNEVLGPVDRGVFQRRIRYYGQLNAGGESR